MAKLPIWAIHGEGDLFPIESIVKPMQALMENTSLAAVSL
jgi:hypothetical protein